MKKRDRKTLTRTPPPLVTLTAYLVTLGDYAFGVRADWGCPIAPIEIAAGSNPWGYWGIFPSAHQLIDFPSVQDAVRAAVEDELIHRMGRKVVRGKYVYTKKSDPVLRVMVDCAMANVSMVDSRTTEPLWVAPTDPEVVARLAESLADYKKSRQ